MDIAAASTSVSTAQVMMQASIAMVKNAMEHTEEIATQMIDQLLTLDVGNAQQSRIDISV